MQLNTGIIAAPATANGVGAIALIRVSGAGAIPLVFNIFKPANTSITSTTVTSHKAYFGNIVEGDEVVDEVLVTFFKAPRTFTGEDLVEISCHGSGYIVSEVMKLLLAEGVSLAKPGEFTMRAFMNGRMDLSQAEAIGDLIAAESQAQHRLAMQQMKGAFSTQINTLRQELIDFAALLELELDFGEEDVEFASRPKLMQSLEEISGVVDGLVESFAVGNAIKNGVPVVIAGKPNAGKSTLLNALLGEERAIVSSIAGTTRDTIEDTITIDGILFRFIDTAGLRQTTDTIEQIGIERAYQKIQKASVVIYITDAANATAESLTEEYQAAQEFGIPFLFVANKADIATNQEYPAETIAIAAKTGEGLTELKTRLTQLAGINTLNQSALVVTNLRHYNALQNALTALTKTKESITQHLSPDLTALELRQALHYLGEITGTISNEDILGSIFSRFCIGK